MGAIDSHLKAFVSTAFNTGRIGRLSSKRRSLAIGFIHAKLGEDVCLEDIARAAGLSMFHFSRAFRNTTGVAPYGYLRQARVERVRKLLVASEKTLSQISLAAGFSDQSHMSKVFKRFTGVTPGIFRNTSTADSGDSMKEGRVGFQPDD